MSIDNEEQADAVGFACRSQRSESSTLSSAPTSKARQDR
jgi:hypothetical protein